GEQRGREADLGAARDAFTAAQGALDAAKGALVDHVTREVETRNATAVLGRRGEDIARQLDKLRGEEATLEQRRLEIDAQLAARRVDLEQLRGELAAATGAQDARAQEVRALAEA